MNLQCRSFSRHSLARSEPFLKYLKPGALARLRDSRRSGRPHRSSSIFQISPSSPPSNGDQPFSVAVDSFPCLLATGRAYGPGCLRRKKLCASKGMVFLSSTAPALEVFLSSTAPALDLPDQSVDLLTSE